MIRSWSELERGLDRANRRSGGKRRNLYQVFFAAWRRIIDRRSTGEGVKEGTEMIRTGVGESAIARKGDENVD